MAISAASPSDGATTTASSPALQQHEVAPVEMSEREKFLLDMNGDRAQPVISIDEQFSFQPVDLCSIARRISGGGRLSDSRGSFSAERIVRCKLGQACQGR
jgi:hypothetical protein